jgi:hypothetical protein
MKTEVRLAIFILLLGFSFAAKAVSMGQALGKIVEKETGKPVAYAIVIIENKMDKIEVTANEYGYYYADHVPTGKYQMRVSFNKRVFMVNHVRIYDSYASEVNFSLSSDESLPATVELESKEPLITSVSAAGINLTNNDFNQATQSLGDLLSMQPGVDVIDGKVFIKGSDQVQFFVDGCPVMGRAIVGRSW